MRINDPHEVKSLGGWIDKAQNLADLGKDNYALNGLVKTQLSVSSFRAYTRRKVKVRRRDKTLCGHA